MRVPSVPRWNLEDNDGPVILWMAHGMEGAPLEGAGRQAFRYHTHVIFLALDRWLSMMRCKVKTDNCYLVVVGTQITKKMVHHIRFSGFAYSVMSVLPPSQPWKTSQTRPTCPVISTV